MHEILNVLIRLMAPIMSFSAHEVWKYMNQDGRSFSVHTELFIPVKENYKDAELADRWGKVIRLRREVTKVLEIARKNKEIGHSLDASVTLGVTDELRAELMPYQDQLRSVFIVSSVGIKTIAEVDGGIESEEIAGLKIAVGPSEDPKCERCWVHDPTVGDIDQQPTICRRCHDAVAEMGLGAA